MAFEWRSESAGQGPSRLAITKLVQAVEHLPECLFAVDAFPAIELFESDLEVAPQRGLARLGHLHALHQSVKLPGELLQIGARLGSFDGSPALPVAKTVSGRGAQDV